MADQEECGLAYWLRVEDQDTFSFHNGDESFLVPKRELRKLNEHLLTVDVEGTGYGEEPALRVALKPGARALIDEWTARYGGPS